jgi:hypothetical protein
MNKALRSCIFCGGKEKLSKEHVIPVWLNRFVEEKDDGRQLGLFRGLHLSSIGYPLDERTAGKNSHTLGKICQNCNNGWMSRTEAKFKDLIDKKVWERERKLSKSERFDISLWIIKTGIVAHFSSNYRRILPDQFPLDLKNGHSIPSSTTTFYGYVVEDQLHPIRWVQTPFRTPMIIQANEIDVIDANNSSFIFCLEIKGLFFGFTWHKYDKNKYRVRHVNDKVGSIYPSPVRLNHKRPMEDLFDASFSVRIEKIR